MSSFEQQVLLFQRQVRATSKVGLVKTKRKLEIAKKALKSDSLDDDYKEFLEVTVSQLESEIKHYEELIAQTRRHK